MNPNKLTTGTKIKGRTSGAIREIQDFKPTEGKQLRQWQVNGTWFNFAELDARYSLYNPDRKGPKKKEAVA